MIPIAICQPPSWARVQSEDVKGSLLRGKSADRGPRMFNVTSELFAQSCPTLHNPMDCSTPGFPVHHQLPEPTQTHVHRVSDAIQPSHPLSSPLLPPSIFPSIRVFSDKSALRIKWAKYWSFSFSISPSNEYSGLISFNIDWLNQSILKVSLGVAKCPLGAKITAPPPHVPQIENHCLKAI